ncbi:MAG: hypothetical protein FWF05_07885 [Oscillospiraceae bacterium]|nr:hypothetical protein [Oscillospiraceae bacterium]
MAANITIKKDKKHQTFEGFGVSGAWWAQDIGGWEETDPESGMPKRERIAQLLFDKSEGIGVGAYRYNLGGGSMQSGRGTFSPNCRRAESFDVSDTEYDWSRDKNAVWTMNAAVRYGADEVILFVNSPPERLTKNNKSHLDKPLRTNLAEENYLPFAKYCLDVAEHFVKQGVPVKYISPVNEPVWVWTGGQEGCHYRPRQVRGVMRVFAGELEKRPVLKGVRLSGAENGDLRWFNKTYCRMLLDDELVRRNIDSIDTHSYYLMPLKIMRLVPFLSNRIGSMKRYKKWMDKRYPGVSLKTTEWTHMKGGRDYGMDSALEQARVMLEDITVMDAAAWQLWIAVSNVDYCDGLIYQFDEDRTFKMTKRYYAFGNYSKFVESGSVRVETDCDDGELKTLAFVKGDRTALIVINATDKEKTVRLADGGKAVMYVTDDNENLTEREVELSAVRISGRSVNTLIRS